MKTTEIKVTGYESRVTPTGLHDTKITVAAENITATVKITTGSINFYDVTVFADDKKVAAIYADADKVIYEAKKVTESKKTVWIREKGHHDYTFTREVMKEYKSLKGFNAALDVYGLDYEGIIEISNAAIDALIKIRDDEKAELNLVDNFISQAVKDDEITAELISKGEINANDFFKNLANGDESYIACVDLPTSYEADVACRVMDKAGLTNDRENCLYEYSCTYTWLNKIELKRNALVKICKAYNRPIIFKLYEEEIAEVINRQLIDATDEICTADAIDACVEAMEAADEEDDVAESAIEYEANAYTSKTEYGEKTSDPDIQALIDEEDFNYRAKSFIKDCANYAKAMRDKTNSENAAKISSEVTALWSQMQKADELNETVTGIINRLVSQAVNFDKMNFDLSNGSVAVFDYNGDKNIDAVKLIVRNARLLEFGKVSVADMLKYGENCHNCYIYYPNDSREDYRFSVTLNGLEKICKAYGVNNFAVDLLVSKSKLQLLSAVTNTLKRGFENWATATVNETAFNLTVNDAPALDSVTYTVSAENALEKTAASDDSDDARIAVLQSEIAETEKDVDALFDKRFYKYSEITEIMEKQAKAAVKEYGLNEDDVECYAVNGFGIDLRINLDGELIHAHSIKDFKAKLKAKFETSNIKLKDAYENMNFAEKRLNQARHSLAKRELERDEVRKNARSYATREDFRRAFNIAQKSVDDWFEKCNNLEIVYEESKEIFESLATQYGTDTDVFRNDDLANAIIADITDIDAQIDALNKRRQMKIDSLHKLVRATCIWAYGKLDAFCKKHGTFSLTVQTSRGTSRRIDNANCDKVYFDGAFDGKGIVINISFSSTPLATYHTVADFVAAVTDFISALELGVNDYNF